MFCRGFVREEGRLFPAGSFPTLERNAEMGDGEGGKEAVDEDERGGEGRLTIAIGIMIAIAIGSRRAVVAGAVMVALAVFVSL